MHAAAHPSPALDILMHSQKITLLDHADEELASKLYTPRRSSSGLWTSNDAAVLFADLCSAKATAEEQAQCWEVSKRWSALCQGTGQPISDTAPSCHVLRCISCEGFPQCHMAMVDVLLRLSPPFLAGC